MIPDIITNLSEEQLKAEFESFKQVCEDCREIHHVFSISTPCESCQNRPIVNGLRRHFEKL